MSVQEIVDVDVRIRVMQLRVDAAQQAADNAARMYLEQVDRANRIGWLPILSGREVPMLIC